MKNVIGFVFCFLLFFKGTLFAFNKEKPFVQEYHKPYPLQTTEQNDVRAVAVDLSGIVWVGTKAGLFKLDQSNGNWKSVFSDKDQGSVYDLFVDTKGKIWVAAWNGVYWMLAYWAGRYYKLIE